MRRGSVLLAAVVGAAAGCARTVATYEVVRDAPIAGAAAARALPADDDSALAAAFAPGVFRTGGITVPYRLLAPSAPATGARFPLVLILHGSNAIGEDNRAQLGPFAQTWASPELRRRFAAFVVVPQSAARSAVYGSDALDSLPSSEGTASLDAALALVEHLMGLLPVDPRRVYVVGFSMGGSATWNSLLRRPGLFAAAVPIAGVPPSRAAAAALAGTPILIVHGTADGQNRIAADRAMYSALRRVGSRSARFREYVGLDHRVPPDLFAGTAWRTWLFAQARPARRERRRRAGLRRGAATRGPAERPRASCHVTRAAAYVAGRSCDPVTTHTSYGARQCKSSSPS